MAEITIPKMTIVIQKEENGTSDTLTNVNVMDDLTSCVIASWNFAGKSFNSTLWDENTTPTYKDIGIWNTDDAVKRMIDITKSL